MTINCQVCGTANPDSNKYCDGCGVELVNNAPASTAETSAAPSAPLSDVTPPDAAVSVPAPEAPVTPVVDSTSATVPATPLTPPESLTGGTIGSGTTPNPYQTPLSETAIGQMESSAPTTPAAAETAPSIPVPAETPAPVKEAAAPAESAPAETPEAAAPVSTPAPADTTPASTGGTAKLGLKKFGQPTGDFIPLNGEKLVVGRFDASSGPVDIDLGEMAGKEHISRHHAELYLENGVWHVRDLGSTNGVFLKKKGEGTFSPRLQEPAALADGDELAFGNVMLTFNQG